MHCPIKYCKVNHFADDTNLLNCQASINTNAIDKQINYDVNNLSNQLNANKIAFNVIKTEIAMFTPPKKQLDHDGKKLYQTVSVKYVEIHLDKYLIWKQIYNVAKTINKANAVLSKIRHM